MLLKDKKIILGNSLTDKLKRLKIEVDTADAIVIGAGAGLSASAGFAYSGERFHEIFHDFEEKYGFHDMYSGGFYPYKTLEEHWAYWSRYIIINRYQNAPKPVYEKLLKLVNDKEYFVITTNVDHCFQKAGFDKQRLFYTQGDYGLFQCSEPCHQKTYENEAIIKLMAAEQQNMRVPAELLPRCPKCGKMMTMNLRSDRNFVEDDGWHKAAERYMGFIQGHKNSHLLFLELGVGFNTPAIIKYPFWQMTIQNPKAIYACLNYGEASCPTQIERQAICINDDVGETLEKICFLSQNNISPIYEES
ncbi:MAG: Sir2 silent information regulator family NAD-dependent deacetylase [Firmicutes bacterium]|nr:Sir2 silent information regulator family NAD-dependent deacetylase [Bacillota bacterium]